MKKETKKMNAPSDVIGVSEVMSLGVFLQINENNDGRNEVNRIPCRDLMQITAAIASSVPIPEE